MVLALIDSPRLHLERKLWKEYMNKQIAASMLPVHGCLPSENAAD
jgi:hypothetical protein